MDGLRRSNFNVKNFKITGTPSGNIAVPGPVWGKGRVWYVDINVVTTASGDGKTWEGAFLTVNEAVDVAGDYDVIMIAPGSYLETSTIEITQKFLKIFGANSTGFSWGGTRIKSSTSEDHIMTINSDGVEVAGISFQCHTDEKDGIRVANSAHTYRTHIHDCYFACNTPTADEGEFGISAGIVSADAPNLHVERCGFYYLGTAGIAVHGTRATITDCVFWVHDGYGIDFRQSGESRNACLAANNIIIGTGDGSGYGIKISATEPTPGRLLLYNNYVTAFASNQNITTTESIEGLVANQTAATAATYKQVDSTP